MISSKLAEFIFERFLLTFADQGQKRKIKFRKIKFRKNFFP